VIFLEAFPIFSRREETSNEKFSLKEKLVKGKGEGEITCLR